MKIIYQLLIVGIVCLLSTKTHAQVLQYSDDGKKACLDCPKKTPENERTDCFCFNVFQFFGFTNSINAAASIGLEGEWLNRQEELLKFELEQRFDRVQDPFSNFTAAQFALFKNITPVLDASKEYRERMRDELESELGIPDNGERYRSSKQNAVVLSSMIKELNNINEGKPREHYFGDLKYDGKRIEDITDGLYLALQATQHDNAYNDELNRTRRRQEVLDKLKFAEERQIAEGVIADRYIGVYRNLPTHREAIEYMTEFMVVQQDDFPIPYSAEYVEFLNSFGPQAPDPLEKDYFNQIRNLILGQSVPLTPVDPYDVAPDEAIYSYALRQIGQTDNTALTSRQFNKKLKEYFKYHKYNQSALDFADTILDSYKNGTSFPHDQYNYSNTNNVFTQSLEAKDLGFRLQQSKIDANRMLEGLPDILDGLSKLPNANNLVGEFIQRLAGANGIDMEGKLTFTETASLFKFTNVYSEPRSRYLNIQVDFKENVGARLCENNIRFPQLLTNPFGILAGLVLANLGDVDSVDEVILDSSFLSTNAYCVYNELKKRNGNLFRKTIGSFIDDPKYKLYFRVGECEDPADMCTDDAELESSSILTIKVDNLGLPPLENASNLLHEGIHAELYRFVDQAHNGEVNPNDRKRLFDLYRNFTGLSDMSSRAQHVYMVENYVTPIAKAIRALDNNSYPLDHYMGYGWDGLRAYDYQGVLTTQESKDLYDLQAIVNHETNFNPTNCN